MITSLHVATGAALGALSRSRPAAAVLGALSHMAGDRLPHGDIASRRFEIVTAAAAILALAARRGPLSPTTVGAVCATVPDLEHVLRLPRPGGRKLFPSHRRRGWHRPGGVPSSVQLLVAGVLLGTLLGLRSSAKPPYSQ